MYDTSHLETLLAQQEEEWESRDLARRKKSGAHESAQSDGKENDGFKDKFEEEEENPLELSAHASADESEDSSSPNSERSFSSDEESDTNNFFPSKRRHIHPKSKKNNKKNTDKKTDRPQGNANPTSTQLIEDSDCVVANFLPRLSANSQQLATTARLLRDRFAAFFSAQTPSSLSSSSKPEIKGASKLMRRLDKEVQMAEEAAAKDEALRLLKRADTEDCSEHLEDGRQPYVRCNSLVFFEILLACLENERDVVAVVEVEQFKDNADNKSSGGNSGGGALPAWARMSVEIDVISQNGARWIRLKGTSLKNLEADFLGNSDRKPFVSTAKNFVRAAKNHLLPYGRHPSTVIIISELPEEEEEGERDEETRTRDGELEHPRLKIIRETVYDALCRDAGVDTVISYYNRALISEVAAEIDLYGTDVCADDATRWASSLLPEAVEARLSAHRRLWGLRNVPRALKSGRFCHSLLPSAAPLASVPRLVNFDVTALVAVCSDTCHEFDLSTAYTLDSYAVLRRQVSDEERTQTLDEHAYPLLDRLTVEGAPRWWREKWGRSAPDPSSGEQTLCIDREDGENGEHRIDREAGATNEKTAASVAAVSSSSCTPIPEFLQFKYPFTHDQLVAYIDGIAAEAWRAKKSLRATESGRGDQRFTRREEAHVEGGKEVKETNHEGDAINEALGGPPKPSDTLWTPEQHAEERRKDQAFPHRLNWIMTDVALAEFSWILKTIAGTMELPRAEWLLKHIHVIPSEAFVHVELDPIFSLDAETPTERKERRRNDDKMQRKLFQERQAEAKRKREEERAREATIASTHFNNRLALFGDVEKLPKGVNRTSIRALEAAARSELLELEINNNEGSGGQSSNSSSTPVSKREMSCDNIPCPSTEASSSEGRSTLFDILPSHVHLLECTGKIKSRHKAVFGVGDALRATTLTANEQFLKAALEQQIRLDVVVHHSRALVGKKVSAGLLQAKKAKVEEGNDM